MDLQKLEAGTRRRGPDRQPRISRMVNDDGLAATLRTMCESAREVDVAERLLIGRSTLRRIIRGAPFCKGLRLHLLGKVEAICEHFLNMDKWESQAMLKTGVTNASEDSFDRTNGSASTASPSGASVGVGSCRSIDEDHKSAA